MSKDFNFDEALTALRAVSVHSRTLLPHLTDEIERKIISMFSLGMSYQDIAGHVACTAFHKMFCEIQTQQLIVSIPPNDAAKFS
jgi:hypothetical protein